MAPPPAKKPTIDLSGMITSALKAQTQGSLGTGSAPSATSTPVKKAVPSLTSFSISSRMTSWQGVLEDSERHKTGQVPLPDEQFRASNYYGIIHLVRMLAKI
ncbi:unnamed protein product [Caenorhabditis brenneri]